MKNVGNKQGNKKDPIKTIKQDYAGWAQHQVGVVRRIIYISNKHHFITSFISSFHARVVEIIATHRLILRSASTVFDPSVDEYNLGIRQLGGVERGRPRRRPSP